MPIGVMYRKGGLKKPGLAYFYAGKVITEFAIRISKGKRSEMFFGTTKDGKAAGALNYLGAVTMSGLIKRRLREGKWDDFMRWSDYYTKWRADREDGPGRFWHWSGRAINALRPIKMIGGSNRFAVGVLTNVMGLQSPNRRSGGKPIPVSNYVFYGLRGSKGKGDRYQPPRNFYHRAVNELVSIHAPKLAGLVENILNNSYSGIERNLMKQARISLTKHETAVEISAQQLEQKINAQVPGIKDMSDESRRFIAQATAMSLSGDGAGIELVERPGGMSRKVEKSDADFVMSIASRWIDRYGISDKDRAQIREWMKTRGKKK